MNRRRSALLSPCLEHRDSVREIGRMAASRGVAGAASPAYRKAKARTLAAVFDINRRPLRDAARQFDGLM